MRNLEPKWLQEYAYVSCKDTYIFERLLKSNNGNGQFESEWERALCILRASDRDHAAGHEHEINQKVTELRESVQIMATDNLKASEEP